MRDARTILLALLICTPFACSHENRDAQSPPQGSAGGDVGPAPATTNEPVVPGVPNAINEAPPQLSGGTPRAGDSRNLVTSTAVAQPMPSTGGTLGTGGSGSGGLGAGPGSGGGGTGGGIH